MMKDDFLSQFKVEDLFLIKYVGSEYPVITGIAPFTCEEPDAKFLIGAKWGSWKVKGVERFGKNRSSPIVLNERLGIMLEK